MNILTFSLISNFINLILIKRFNLYILAKTLHNIYHSHNNKNLFHILINTLDYLYYFSQYYILIFNYSNGIIYSIEVILIGECNERNL